MTIKSTQTVDLRKGELKRPNGTFAYRWQDSEGKRHMVYAPTLDKLRLLENEIQNAKHDHLNPEGRNKTVNDLFVLWTQLKRGLKDNTFQNYQYMYRQFVFPAFGKRKVTSLVKSDVKRFYNTLADERGLQISTIEIIHNVLHQVLDLAVEDCYIRINPSEGALRELKKARAFEHEKRHALTRSEQKLFMAYLKNTPAYRHWYPVFAVLLGTGLRVGEAVGLRWSDISLEDSMIDVNHTLVYYNHATDGCYCNIHTPKTMAGVRKVPMLDFVKDAFLEERRNQEKLGIHCTARIDGYTDFIFVNRFGGTQHQGTLNKALRRIIRDCNNAILEKDPSASLLLPHFSCHSLRHTFTTRMCEAGINIKVIQETLGHADISTTLNIYTDVTRDFHAQEFTRLDADFSPIANQ